MTGFVANARMYSVAPEAEAAWRALIAQVAEAAEVSLTYEAYPAPQALEALWRRPDLGLAQMCGYPIALGIAEVVPIAAPIPAFVWAGGRAVYRTDLIVRADAPFRSIEETFGHRLGWTVAHSHSGFNALRHHLLPHFRANAEAPLYAEVRTNLITARAILDDVLEDRIDVGPMDAYWFALLQRYRPEVTAGVRVLESTEVAPMPAFVASPGLPAESVARLKQAFADAATQPWFARHAEALLIEGFAPVTLADFAPTMAWDAEAVAAGYPLPA